MNFSIFLIFLNFRTMVNVTGKNLCNSSGCINERSHWRWGKKKLSHSPWNFDFGKCTSRDWSQRIALSRPTIDVREFGAKTTRFKKLYLNKIIANQMTSSKIRIKNYYMRDAYHTTEAILDMR